MKKFIKQLFCSHIWRLSTQEYVYSKGILIHGQFREYKRVFINYYICVKCSKTKIKSMEIDII